MKKYVLLLPVTSQPRFIRRIKTLLNSGANVDVASYERDYFNLNKLPAGIGFFSLGRVENKKYIQRVKNFFVSLSGLKKFVRGADCIYSFSIDLLVLSFFVKTPQRYFEVGDLREISNPFLKGSFHYTYGKLLNKVDRIFVTSLGFKKYLAEKHHLNSDKITIIENKLSATDFDFDNRKEFKVVEDTEAFCVGIIGLLRYECVIDFLKAYKSSKATFKVKIFGDGPLRDRVLPFVDDKNIFFNGQFKYPDGLDNIYNQVDLSFVMYDSTDLNVRLALPNKLYESMYFATPLVVSTNTFLAEQVHKYQIGFSWPQNDMVKLVEKLDSDAYLTEHNNYKKSLDTIEKSDAISEY
ncbi:glycosyltransferase [Mucilaginibacter aquariorum]|uniref:Glycosyltransferase n=1 Tax=Mucilaginibacter aquariorum TaxID=2967225 RepID=A0ABT1T8R7_9SPHI|nr:glycosyltransferase [Mucilaginibacter aquariorum]MCQ6960949.1 glycosyltransferase [Mucilaginibacter aquariorum]